MPKTPPIKIPITAEDRTRAAMDGVNRRLMGVTRTMGGLFTKIAAVAGVGGMGYLIKSTIDAADNIGKLSTRLGASTEALSEYQHVAKLSGVTFETLTTSWQRMTRRIAEAAHGQGKAQAALQELRLEARELINLKPEDQFERIAEALSGVTNEGDRVRLAMKLFDSEGVTLLQTMSSGASGIREMREEARKFGLSLSKTDTKAAEDFNDQLTRIETASRGLTIAMTRDLLPSINEVLSAMEKGAKEGGPLEGFAAGLGVLGRQAFSLNSTPINDKIGAILEKQKLLRRVERDIERGVHGAVGGEGARAKAAELRKEIRALNDELTSLMKQTGPTNTGAPLSKVVPKVRAPLPSMPNVGAWHRQAEDESMAAWGVPKPETLQERLENLNAMILEVKGTGLQKQLDVERDYYATEEELARQAAGVQTEIRKKSFDDGLQDMLKWTSGVAQHNRTAFRINKLAAIADAAINLHKGVSKTYAAYPYPWNVPMAAAHAALGIAQINAIKSATFSGGGGGTTPSAVGTTPVINDTPVPATPQSTTRNVTISLQSDSGMVSLNWIRDELMPSLNEALGDGVKINLEGQRLPA